VDIVKGKSWSVNSKFKENFSEGNRVDELSLNSNSMEEINNILLGENLSCEVKVGEFTFNKSLVNISCVHTDIFEQIHDIVRGENYRLNSKLR
jgi:hypothetical protein